MSQPQHLVITPDEAGNSLTIMAAHGRLSKAQSDSLRCLLRSASVVAAVSRCRRGRLKVELDSRAPHADETVFDLVSRDESSIEKRARRETERRSDTCHKRERREKVFLADAGRYVEDADVLRLLDEQEAVALSRELPELNDPMPALELPESVRQLELQFTAA